MIVLEDTSDDDDGGQDNTEVEVVLGGVIVRVALDAIGQEAEDGTDPEKGGETAKQIAAKFNPLGGGFWWSQLVVSVAFQTLKVAKFWAKFKNFEIAERTTYLFGIRLGETTLNACFVLLTDFFNRISVFGHFDLLTEIGIFRLTHDLSGQVRFSEIIPSKFSKKYFVTFFPAFFVTFSLKISFGTTEQWGRLY